MFRVFHRLLVAVAFAGQVSCTRVTSRIATRSSPTKGADHYVKIFASQKTRASTVLWRTISSDGAKEHRTTDQVLTRLVKSESGQVWIRYDYLFAESSTASLMNYDGHDWACQSPGSWGQRSVFFPGSWGYLFVSVMGPVSGALEAADLGIVKPK